MSGPEESWTDEGENENERKYEQYLTPIGKPSGNTKCCCFF
jgi:hypothetical protein